MTSPLVSILIPAFNAERWIAETIQSALQQTWPAKEIIVVDDGSRDSTLAMARQFAGPTVLVLSQKNLGAAAARNTAYRASQGDYVQWLDADDLLAPDKVQRQMERAAQLGDKRILLSSAWAWFAHRPHAARFESNALWADLSPADWLLHKLEKNLHMQTATWLTSRDLAEAAGPWDTQMWVDDDGEYFCRVLLASKGTAFVPEARVFYRTTNRHRLSVIGLSERKKDAMILSMRRHIAALRSLEESERMNQACLRYLQNWLPAFYPERPDIIDVAQGLAAELGGRLQPPCLSWKYSWIRMLAGWQVAKRAQIVLPYVRATIAGTLEETLYRLEKLMGLSRDLKRGSALQSMEVPQAPR